MKLFLFWLFVLFPVLVYGDCGFDAETYMKRLNSILTASYILEDESSVDHIDSIEDMERDLKLEGSLLEDVESDIEVAEDLESKLRKIVVEGRSCCLDHSGCDLLSVHSAVSSHLRSLINFRDCISTSCSDYFRPLVRISGTGTRARMFVKDCFHNFSKESRWL